MLRIKKADAIKFYGSAANLARALGVTRQAISDWDEYVPESRVYQLQVMTGGRVKSEKAA